MLVDIARIPGAEAAAVPVRPHPSGESAMTGTRASGAPVRCLHLFTGPMGTGPFATVDGVRTEVPDSCVRLIVWLALRRTRVDRSLAAGTLWPCVDDRRAAGNLRSALWRLRGAGPDVVDADKTTLGLHTDVGVDVHLAADWAQRVIGGNAHGSDVRIVPWFTDAIDLLPGWDDDWVILERERLRHRTLHAFEALSRLLCGHGRHAEGVGAARTVVAADPLRESAQRALVDAHLAAGDVTESRRVIEEYTRIHRRVFGVEPSPRLGKAMAAWTPGPTVSRA
ncbi:MAG: bacterial transcriptional activator domain-containing protein [Actinobacteria bacterium]|nr:bacterial transcriptional activator domain-containing protein [Actinomycetota bacterium]